MSIFPPDSESPALVFQGPATGPGEVSGNSAGGHPRGSDPHLWLTADMGCLVLKGIGERLCWLQVTENQTRGLLNK